jgi:hypothetical protein
MTAQGPAYDNLGPLTLLEKHNRIKMKSYICLPVAAGSSLVMTGLPSIILGPFASASQPQATKIESGGGGRSRSHQLHAQEPLSDGS